MSRVDPPDYPAWPTGRRLLALWWEQRRRAFRGLVCEVHPDRSQMRTAIRFEPVQLPDVARDDLVVDPVVWDAVDEHGSRVFDLWG